MHRSLELLEQAISLAEAEAGMVETDEAEGLEESAARRQALIAEAIECKDGCDADAMLAALEKLLDLQTLLSARANARLEEDREALRAYQQTSRVLSGYRQSARGRRGPRVFNKFS